MRVNIYNSIISCAQSQNRDKNNGIYYEKHHIIPKCLGGDNSNENLVLLTAKEHFIAHHLLTKIYPGNHKIYFAFRAMCILTDSKKRNYKITSVVYENCKNDISLHRKYNGKHNPNYGKRWSKKQKESVSGRNNHMYGKSQSLESNKKRSIALKGQKNPSFAGFWKLPDNSRHQSLNLAANHINICKDCLRIWCKNNEKIITSMMIIKSKYLQDIHLGRTFKDLGFDYLPV